MEEGVSWIFNVAARHESLLIEIKKFLSSMFITFRISRGRESTKKVVGLLIDHQGLLWKITSVTTSRGEPTSFKTRIISVQTNLLSSATCWHGADISNVCLVITPLNKT
ncbi:hypothetical protein Ccrd_017387 [Cynara cardunculus var. scolymus]|uniref:Uncharacterized protein n=1 Tax=Cynara cardunculus var. scolymus TaxID=59895 RepID=A0A118K2F8_CYNCS|nr:hypothetical protein Ccrd_017387 [Cynara cardunculus var. scolymus]